jgi:uncharacterized protein YbjT (DUF2867 family)
VFVNVTAVGSMLKDLMTEAARAGTRTAVMLSSLTVRDNGPQPYSIGAHHKALEDVVAASGLEWTFLRCGGFAANTLAWAPMIRAEGVVRAPYLDRPAPLPGRVRRPHSGDVARPAGPHRPPGDLFRRLGRRPRGPLPLTGPGAAARRQ